MPYYQVRYAGSFNREKESFALVYDRPISFVTPLEMGLRQFKFVGPKQLEIEVKSHDEAVARLVWGDSLLLHLKHHDIENEKRNESQIPGSVFSLAARTEQESCESVRLLFGYQLKLDKTSLYIDGNPDSQFRWTLNSDGPAGDIFGHVVVETIKRF